MIFFAFLWYGLEELTYWIWWALTGKELDFYEKCRYVYVLVIISLVIGIIIK